MSAPRLTIAIPYYRGRDYLREAIESVLAQTVDEWRLIVVDDHGPEPADALVAGFEDPRIAYVRNEVNLGLAGNWNECVRLARTPLVTLLHGDDRLRPGYVAAVLAASDAHPDCAAVFTDATNIDGAGRPVATLADRVKARMPRPAGDHRLSGDDDLAGLLAGNYIICPTLCLRRSAIGDAPFDAGLRFVPDWDLTSRILLEGGSLYAVRSPLLEYRRHGSSETTRLTEDASRFVEEFAFLRRRARECERAGLPRSAARARRRLTARGHLAVLAVIDAAHGRLRAARAKASLLREDLARRD